MEPRLAAFDDIELRVVLIAHFDQAVFADELSARSLQALRGLVQSRWRELAAALVPAIEALIEQDRAEGRAQDRRMRVGLYSFEDRMPADPATDPGTGG